MGGNTFRFKRFYIDQQGCAMKVGTDGVLLGAWCRLRQGGKRLLDVGSGTGVIALMLAQRTESTDAEIHAVEIEPESIRRCRENFDRSDWKRRLIFHPVSLQNFCLYHPKLRFDHIVSNPPYFTDSLLPPDAARALARHTLTLTCEELMECCIRMLRTDGSLSLILPSNEEEKITATAARYGLGVTRRTEVWSTPRSGPKRLLLEFSQEYGTPECSSLLIEGGPGTFSEEYRKLTRDFYLYF